MKTQVKANDTRFPALTRAVLRHVDRESLEDVARHGADAGWSGFTYYSDTLAFFKRHKADILALAKQQADDFGQGMIEMVRGFRCLGNNGKPDWNEDEIADALYNPRSDSDASTQVQNAMAWYALEEVARELNPDI